MNRNADCLEGHCSVNVGILAASSCWDAACFINLDTCAPGGGCQVNLGVCSAECTVNVRWCDWTGECFVNASEMCNGHCTVALLYACTDSSDACLLGLRTQDGGVDLCEGDPLLS